jgi:hypothetical protein
MLKLLLLHDLGSIGINMFYFYPLNIEHAIQIRNPTSQIGMAAASANARGSLLPSKAERFQRRGRGKRRENLKGISFS